MSALPLTYLEKKWNSGFSNSASNQLYPTSQQTSDRKYIPRLDKDVHRNVSAMGRTTLLTLGRRLYCNPIVSGALDEMVTYASSVFIPQFDGEDEEWGRLAENFMLEHDKICDIAGEPYTMQMFRRLLISSVIVDGEHGMLLTEHETGYPALQTIPSHRIRCHNGEAVVTGGEYDGARIIDGVIVNDSGRAVAYRVVSEDGLTYRDISSRDLKLSFIPKFVGQLRGYSLLGESAFDWQDVEETRLNEKVSQKLGSSFGFMVKNETGEVDEAKAAMRASASPSNSDGSKDRYNHEVINGVTVRYFKANKGEGLEAVKNDRPSMNQQAFEDKVVRGAFKGMNWDVDFSLDPSKVGGASMRVVIEKVNRQIAKLQDLILEPAIRRFDGYRVAKVMDNPDRADKRITLLPFNKDWYKWTYQKAARLTADAKYDSDIDLSEVASGLKTRRKAVANRGDYLEDVDKEAVKDAKTKWKLAGEVASENGIDIVTAYNSMWNPQPNGIQQQQKQISQETQQ